eukprot:7060958-Prymnesium_polylepis.1
MHLAAAALAPKFRQISQNRGAGEPKSRKQKSANSRLGQVDTELDTGRIDEYRLPMAPPLVTRWCGCVSRPTLSMLAWREHYQRWLYAT